MKFDAQLSLRRQSGYVKASQYVFWEYLWLLLKTSLLIPQFAVDPKVPLAVPAPFDRHDDAAIEQTADGAGRYSAFPYLAPVGVRVSLKWRLIGTVLRSCDNRLT